MKQFRYRFLAWISFVVLTGSSIYGQQSDRITGIITDSATHEPVEYAQILNFSLQKQMYSNRLGEFSLAARPGDTLVIYGMGYFYEKLIVTRGMLESNRVTIPLTRQPYDLSAANITGIGNYEDFRDKLINMEIAQTKTEKLNDQIATASRSAALEAFQQAQNERILQNGVTFLSAHIYTPEEIERMKLAEIKAKDKVRDQVYQKFNPVLIKEITGLTEDEDIIEFMVWCKFSETYILETSTYDLAERIAAKFELFQKMKEEEKIKNDPLNRIDQFVRQFA